MRELLRRRYLISLFYLMVATIGVAMWLRIPVEMAPDAQLPSATVTYGWGIASPETMEREVTRHVERMARRLRDVESIRSTTREGRASVTIQFTEQAPVEFRMVELQEHLRVLEDQLPEGVDPPSFSRSVPSELEDMQDFLIYSISGDMNHYDLLDLARRQIVMPLSGLRGLADIELQNTREPALMVDFDMDLADRLQINTGQVMGRIQERLSWRSAGYLERGDNRFSMMVPPDLDDLEDIRRMPIRLNNMERRIRLDDLAEVSIQDAPATSISRIDGNPAMTIRFEKQAGADAMGLAEEIRERMDNIQADLPGAVRLHLERDATEDLRAQLTELETQAMISLACVFLVLLLFIQRLRAPLIILGSILFSLMLSVTMLYLLDFTVNIITLAGLTISLGMIIDNAVVVFEHLNPRLPLARRARIEHVRAHLPHVLVPVLGSTLTTVGIFIPLLFALDEVRLLLVPLGVALTLTLFASVVISLTWIPYALIWLVRGGVEPENGWKPAPAPAGRLQGATARLRGALPSWPLNRSLLRLFHWRHRLRWPIYVGLVLLIGIPAFLIPEPDWLEEDDDPHLLRRAASLYLDNRSAIDPWIGGISYRFADRTHFGESWGQAEREYITVSIRPPIGTPFSQIEEIVDNYETIIGPYEHAIDYYESEIRRELGRIRIYFDEQYYFRPEPYRLYAEASYLAARTGNVAISVSGFGDSFSSGFSGMTASFRITLNGYSYEQLEEMAHELKRRLERNERVEDVDINQTGFFTRDELFEYVLQPDRDRMAMLGVNPMEVYRSIETDVSSRHQSRGRVEFDGRDMRLFQRNLGDRTWRDEFLGAVRVADTTRFRLTELAGLEREGTMPEIRREDQAYTRVVGFDFLGPRRFGSEFAEEIVEAFPNPVGTTVETGSGFTFGTGEADRNVLFILAMAVLSVWMIVSALLERWRDPLVILLAIPFSVLGIMAGALHHGFDFDRSAVAGTLLAAGVVVNNAILLMHGKQRMREFGIHGFRSWIYVYREKMRPVLITSLTTLGGLFPLTLFETSEFWQTLATVVCWGLAFSTLFLILLMGMWERNK